MIRPRSAVTILGEEPFLLLHKRSLHVVSVHRDSGNKQYT